MRDAERNKRALSPIDMHDILLPYAKEYAQFFNIGIIDGLDPILPGDIADPVRSPEDSDPELYMADIAVRLLHASLHCRRIPVEGERLHSVGI